MGNVIPVDAFAAEIASIMSDVDGTVRTNSRKAVQKACREGKKNVMAKSAALGVHHGKTWSRYVSGWSYTTSETGNDFSGEIGNADVPGLPHLIEKGHARVGGGRVRGYEHVAPAADETFKEYERQLESGVLSGL